MEVLLSVVLISFMSAVATPLYHFFMVRDDMDVAVNITAQTLRRAQFISQSVDGDSNWGIKLQVGSIVLFKGASYALRDTTYDESYDIAQTVTPSGVTEIVFAKFTGLPGTTGTITFTTTNGETKNISVNSKGMVDY